MFCKTAAEKSAAVFLRALKGASVRAVTRAVVASQQFLRRFYIEPSLDLTFNIYYSNSKYNILIYGVNTNVRQLREDAGKESGTAWLK